MPAGYWERGGDHLYDSDYRIVYYKLVNTYKRHDLVALGTGQSSIPSPVKNLLTADATDRMPASLNQRSVQLRIVLHKANNTLHFKLLY
jgi:hypothetical protein